MRDSTRTSTQPSGGDSLAQKTMPSGRLSPAVVLWALQFLGGLAGAPAYALLAIYIEQSLHQAPLFTASLRSIQLALGGLSAPFAGVLADRIGYKPAYLWGMTSTVAACAVFLTGQPLLLVCLFFYSGLLGSLQTTAGQAYLMEASRRSRLGIASAGYFLGGTLGTALGSAAAGRFLGTASGNSLGHLGSGLLSASRYPPGFGSLGAISTLLALALIAGGLLLPPVKRRAAPRSVELTPSALAPMLGRREVRLLLGIRFLPTCYWGAVTLLVPLLLFRLTRNAATAGAYAGISLALASACQILTGRVCDRFGLRLPVLIAPTGITLSALGLAWGARSVPALWVFGVLGACSAWSLSTTMPLLIDDASGPGEKGRIVGLTALAWNAGMLSGNQVAGKLATPPWGAADPGLPFALAALCGLGTLGLAVAITKGDPASGIRQGTAKARK
jgi:MFS family permease